MRPYSNIAAFRQGATETQREIDRPDLCNKTAQQTGKVSESATCLRCSVSLVPDYERQECYCSKCGYTQPLGIGEPDDGQKPAGLPKPRQYPLGSSNKHILKEKDWQNNWVSSQVRADLKTALKWDKQKTELDEAAVEHIVRLYNSFVYPTYDDGLRKADLEILKQHAKNMVAATGPKQDELRLMEAIRYFLRKKLEKFPELKMFFKLGSLHVKIRYKRERPQNISGRGNQLGKRRKEDHIEHCNICDTPIENYGAREHHEKHHLKIPYHQYISGKNQHVRRAVIVQGVTADCAYAKEDKASVERGPCTHCDAPDAIIRRYRVMVSKKGRVDVVSRIVARHRDIASGRWKACILEQHKRGKA